MPALLAALAALAATTALAQVPLDSASISVSGVFPSISGTAESAPKRSECGVGAMMAWANQLYYVTYLSVPDAGNGTGLYAVDQNMRQTLLANHSSVFANRLLIPALNSIVIGPYVIDAAGGIRTITALLDVRIGGMAEHLTDPTRVYMLGMDGPLWEVDLVTLQTTQLFDMIKELNMCTYPVSCPEQPHFKAAHSMAGVLWVATNVRYCSPPSRNCPPPPASVSPPPPPSLAFADLRGGGRPQYPARGPPCLVARPQHHLADH